MTITETLSPAEAQREAAVYQNGFRRRRLARFVEIVDAVLREKDTCRIIDLGGGPSFWLGLEDAWAGRPIHITLVNVASVAAPDERFTSLLGDACDLAQFPDRSFDVVHSNSVIEHVGNWSRKKRMAAEARRLAPRYFVQTPNFWFPVEPHFRTVGFHWMPRPVQRSLVMSAARGFHPRAKTLDQADGILNDASLLDRREMAELFPDARIERERFAGLTKSLIAVR
jgi:hypothetical protein